MRPYRHQLNSVLFALLAASMVYGVLHLLFDYQRQKNESRLHVAAADYGNVLHAAIDRTLNAHLFISYGLASYIKVYRNALQHDTMQAMFPRNGPR